MKQWKSAAGLAGLASLVRVASLGWGSGSTDPSRSDQQAATTASAQAGAAGPGDSPYRASDRSGRATIALPAIQAGRPVPLRLARGTLERAWHDGKFHVALPGGGPYSVALHAKRLDPRGPSTVVTRRQA